MGVGRVLVTGATGYIGGRLVPRLLAAGYSVRLLVRDRARIVDRPWASEVEVVEGDLLQPHTLVPALSEIDAAYYLVHSMGGAGDFSARDKQAAMNFAEAGAKLKHVIYLGGLQPTSGTRASRHLSSRAETGEVLRRRLPTTEFRAGPIVGAGSASFEMVRYLVERLPVMITPRWAHNEVQPIAVSDIMRYLVASLEREPMGVVCVGGPALTFTAMMREYAQVRGLRRWIVSVPVLTPTLSARWVGLVTPIPNRLAVPLVQGVIEPLLLPDDRARVLFPDIEPMEYRKAVERALARTEQGEIETHWSGALGGEPIPTGEQVSLEDREGLIREVRIVSVAARPAALFESFSSLGGERGWLVWNWAWRLRGAFDRIIGGPGLRRGRRDPRELRVGEAVDFWRVEQVEPPSLLRLRAEMKVPGRAWLQWQVDTSGGRTRLVQTALFEPRGLLGALYWYALYPAHRLIFTALARAIARDAEGRDSAPAPHGGV